MKTHVLLVLFLLAGFAAAAPVATVQNVTQDAATGNVTVRYTLAGEDAIITFDVLTNGVPVSAGALAYADGDVYRLVATGSRSFVWNAVTSGIGAEFPSSALTVRVNGSYSFSNLSSGMVTVCKQVYEEALRHTGAGNAGDYLLWTVSGSSRQPDLSDFDTGYIEVDCYYTISYRDDAGKEGQVTAAVNSALSSLGVSSKSEYDKIKAIYDYIADKVYYDYDEASSPTLRNPTSYTAYAAMINNKSVCQGYALLFYRMCNQAGISCRIVTGTAMGSNGRENHAWNIVRLGGKYYNVDVTWDSTLKHANRYASSCANAMPAATAAMAETTNLFIPLSYLTMT